MSESNWGSDAPMWRTIPPPFMPCDKDIALLQASLPGELLEPDAAPRILVLGVTPALAGAPWPKRSMLHAVDYDQAMIDVQWTPREGEACHCAYWQDMPFEDGYFDAVIGDCSFNALPGIGDYEAVLREVKRVSKPKAPLVARFFMQSEPRLALADLPGLVADRFAHFAVPARRLLIPMASSEEDGSMHSLEITGKIEQQWGPVDDFLGALGQEGNDFERAKRTFEFDQRLNYPTRARIEAIFSKFYETVEFQIPDYDCGTFCPIVRFGPAR